MPNCAIKLYSTFLLFWLTAIYRFIAATTKFNGTFEQTFSPGEFQDISKAGRQTRPQTSVQEQNLSEADAEVDSEVGIFHCPNEGCIKVFQRYSALEKHLSYGKCVLRPERATLLDQAKQMYHVKLTEGTSAVETSRNEGGSALEFTANSSKLATGWALKKTKKSVRLNETQKKYLDEKFNIGQQAGHKVDPGSVAQFAGRRHILR